MHLLEQYMIEERSTIMEQNISVSVIGRRDGIPEVVQREMDKTIAMSAANTGMRLCLAINYGSRAELVDAVRQIAAACGRASSIRRRSTKRRCATPCTRPACPTPTC